MNEVQVWEIKCKKDVICPQKRVCYRKEGNELFSVFTETQHKIRG